MVHCSSNTCDCHELQQTTVSKSFCSSRKKTIGGAVCSSKRFTALVDLYASRECSRQGHDNNDFVLMVMSWDRTADRDSFMPIAQRTRKDFVKQITVKFLTFPHVGLVSPIYFYWAFKVWKLTWSSNIELGHIYFKGLNEETRANLSLHWSAFRP